MRINGPQASVACSKILTERSSCLGVTSHLKAFFGNIAVHFGDENVTEGILTLWTANTLEMSNDGC